MSLSDHDLLQLTEEELRELPEEVLCRLSDWLGLEISVGTLHATLHESGAAYCLLKTNGWKRYKAVVCCMWTKRPGGN